MNIRSLLSPRNVSLLGLFGCIAPMLFVILYLQHVLNLDACPLCIFQRVAMMGAGLFFLLAAAHNPGKTGLRIYASLSLLFSIGGIIIAGRHTWLQHLPEDQVPACGPGLDYMIDVLPLQQILSVVFQGSGECADISWRFLDLSIPELALLGFICLSGLACYQLFRKTDTA